MANLVSPSLKGADMVLHHIPGDQKDGKLLLTTIDRHD
jgi:hypothetical protein